MGNTPQWPMSYRETVDAINRYEADVASGKYSRADLAHFCGVIGVASSTFVTVAKEPVASNIPISEELKKFVTWIQGEYSVAPGWGGPNASKAIFNLKQDFGGMVYTDRQDVNATGKVTVDVSFGGSKDSFK